MFRRTASLLASVIVLCGAGSVVIAPVASAATPNPTSSQYCTYTENVSSAADGCSAQVAVAAAAPSAATSSAVQSASSTFTITASPAHAASSTVKPKVASARLLRQPGLRRP